MLSMAVVAAGLFLNSSEASLFAQAPPKKDSPSPTDLFQRGWKFDQGIGEAINIPEAIRNYRQAAAPGNSLAQG
jgi:hypothetical protein